jgi:hypothetical protein
VLGSELPRFSLLCGWAWFFWAFLVLLFLSPECVCVCVCFSVISRNSVRRIQ